MLDYFLVPHFDQQDDMNPVIIFNLFLIYFYSSIYKIVTYSVVIIFYSFFLTSACCRSYCHKVKYF